MSRGNWVVVKFGGTSVADYASWINIKDIVQQHLNNNHRVVLVCSAPGRVSDSLEHLLSKAVSGEDYQPQLHFIRSVYQQLAQELSVDFNQALQNDWDELERYVKGVSLLKERSPKCHAKIMSFGEVLLTHLAYQFLLLQEVSVHWEFAGDCLKALPISAFSEASHYVSAQCDISRDDELIKYLDTITEDVIITQGFLATNELNEIVLLERGGSDVSAAYFAAKLAATRCEIWSDVPGIYTANPHKVPEARHLLQLTYEEAQEIALMGAEVLHPRAIAPVAKHGIPLFVGQTSAPKREGTLISAQDSCFPIIKAVSVKRHIIILSLEAIDMWREAGFLAEIFACFKKQNISIDCISTSQANVTVSLDAQSGLLGSVSFEHLMMDLKTFAHVELITPCASISIVGRKIRKVLYQINSIWPLFRSLSVHLLSQAANDLSFSMVVDDDQADRLLQVIHELLIEYSINQSCFGDSYHHEFVDSCQIKKQEDWWYVNSQKLLDHVANASTPLYLYDKLTLNARVNQLLSCKGLDKIFFAVKANSNESILASFYALGVGFECVSIYEVNAILKAFPGIDPHRILFTPNFASRDEYEQAIALGIYLTIDSLYPLTRWPDLFKNKAILLRIDPGFGAGHHQAVETGGNQSKFGISVTDIQPLLSAIEFAQVRIIGLHAHSGSGILNANNWSQLAMKLLSLLSHFPECHIIDLGGGLGVPEKPGQSSLDLEAMDRRLLDIKHQYPKIKFWLEPGRFLVAESGVLLARVTQVKSKGSLTYIGIDAGMHTLIRPALYGSYHFIINLSKLNEPSCYLSHIVGPICESGDVIGRSRWMPETDEGDIMLIANVGAYGFSMSSQYNLRPLAVEQVIS